MEIFAVVEAVVPAGRINLTSQDLSDTDLITQ
jgi:hypothetical protein